MDSRWARVARGMAAATFATFVAAFSHALSGGVPPSWFGVGASLVLSAMACTLLTGRTLSTWRLTVAIGLSQFLFHALFSGVGSPIAAEHHMTAMGPDASSLHDHAGTTMWAAHAVAALLTIVAFRHGERAFWTVVATARLLFTRLLVVTVPVLATVRAVVAVERRFIPRYSALLLSSMRHRGPPLGISA